MARLKNPPPSNCASDSSSSEQVQQPKNSISEEEVEEVEEETNAPENEDEEIRTSPQSQKNPSSGMPEANAVVTVSSKRHSDCEADVNTPIHQSKRPKKSQAASVAEESGKGTGKSVIQRVFSEEDEVQLLNSMLEYSAKKGVSRIVANSDFYDFVIESMNNGFTKGQLKDKIKRLKANFRKNGNRRAGNSHDQTIYILGKKLWGEKIEKGNAMEGRDVTVKKKWGTVFDMCNGQMEMEYHILQQGMAMLRGESKIAFEKKWKKVEKMEMKAFVARKEVMLELSKEMMKSSSNST